MYREAVGRYGMAPDYFFRSLGLSEAEDFIEGARKREREPWERLRMMAKIVCRSLTGDDLDMKLAWELPTDEEIEEQTADAMAAAKIMEQMVAAGQLKIEPGRGTAGGNNERK